MCNGMMVVGMTVVGIMVVGMMVVEMVVVGNTICFWLCGRCLVFRSVRCNSLLCVME